MDIILFIIVVCVLIHQNNKINRLEQLIKSAPQRNPEKSPAQNSLESALPAASPVALTPAQTQPVQSAQTAPVPDITSEEMSGRILGRIGIGALIIGVAFFLKYAFDNNWIGPAGRVMIGILIGIALMSVGQWLRKKYLAYSDLLMGGGLAVLYLSVYAAHALYNLIDPMSAFLGMIVVTAVGVAISIANATQTLSIIALIGGYIAPLLIGVSLLGPWVTFTYITILNAGVLGVMAYKKWGVLVLIGLFGTWLHFGSWLMSSYTPDLLIPTVFFIVVQFLIFTAASVVRVIVEKRQADETDYLALSITALAFVWSCWYILMPQYKGFFSLGLVAVAALYGGIALFAYKQNPQDRTLNIFLPGLSVAFLTLAIFIEFSGPWIPAWWFIESIVLYAVASRSSSRGYQVMGVVVYILGVLNMFYYIFSYQQPAGFVVFFNGPFAMLVLSILTAYAIAFVYYRYGSVSPEIQKRGIAAFSVIANILTVYAFTSQISAYYNLPSTTAAYGGDYGATANSLNTAVSIFWALYAALLTAIGFAKKYAVVRRMGLVLFILTACKVVLDVWSLGQLYRIVSFIVFGVIALVASFVYVKYRDRLKDVV